jgi:hypothetical protein
LVTTSASSAKCMAISAPVSMPAGESQTMYSKPIAARSVSTFSTPSCVSASLSRVWLAAQHEQVVALLVLDQRLVQVGLAVDHIDQVVHHAAFAAHDEVEVAQTHVEVDDGGLVAAQGQAGEKLALVVVLPTPPLPEVTTMILVMKEGFLVN